MPEDNDNDEEHIPDTLEEAGGLEADVGARFDQQLANIDPNLNIGLDPYAHRQLRPEMMFIREELRQAKLQTLACGYCLRVFPLESRHYVHFTSYVVRVPKPLLKTITSTDSWPKDVVFRRFRGMVARFTKNY